MADVEQEGHPMAHADVRERIADEQRLAVVQRREHARGRVERPRRQIVECRHVRRVPQALAQVIDGSTIEDGPHPRGELTAAFEPPVPQLGEEARSVSCTIASASSRLKPR
jgi:hypothetical protein